ncbi:MAG: ArgE/DapE family deacylase [Myxococcota bacterium]|nr:ArgE/DapE family deacylase [Myxococcota bacterium]
MAAREGGRALTVPDATIQAALKAVDAQFEQTVSLLQEFVRIPSVIGDEGQAQQWAAARMRELGLGIREVLIPDEELMKHPSAVEGPWRSEGRPNIIGRWKGRGTGSSLLLNAHVDVVSEEPRSQWTREPYGATIEGDRMYGRGALDMKGGWLAIYAALRALRTTDFQPGGDLVFQSVVEEEGGGTHGTLATFLAGETGDAMIIPEPLWSHLVIGHPGILYFRVEIDGHSVHAALAHHGVSALFEILPIIEALKALDEDRAQRLHLEPFERLPGAQGQSVHLNLGSLQAGDWPSTVPGQAVLEGRVSYLPFEEADEVMAAITGTILGAATSPWLVDHPPRISWPGWRGVPWLQDPEHPFVQHAIDAIGAERGRPPGLAADTAGLDARFAGEFGVPCVVFGPDGENLHGIDEWVSLSSVRVVARSLVRLICSWSG